MSEQQYVVTLTLNPTIDKSTNVDTVASEIKLRCDDPKFDPGGGGINVSRAMFKLGGTSTAFYTAGGGVGDMLRSLLEAEGLLHEALPIEAYTRENLTVYETSSGLQYRFGMPGPVLEEIEWQASIQSIVAQDADIVVGSGSLPQNVPDDYYAQLADAIHAQKSDAKIIIDTSGEPLKKVAYKGVFLIKPNFNELEHISGKKFEGEKPLKDVAQSLIKDGLAEVMVISMGSGGAALISQDEYVTLRPPVVPIKSKVGAGDSMVGGLVLSLARGDDLVTAARWGVAAGSAAVMTEGTQLCRRDDTEMLFEQIQIMR
jgi:6-phosphofructokinase 2